MPSVEQIDYHNYKDMLCLQKHITRYTVALPYCTGAYVADVGSGYGCGTWWLGRPAESVVGFELNAEVCAIAAERYKAEEHISFRSVSWMDEVENEQYGTIVAFEVFEHIEANLCDIIRHTYRCLKPGGILVGSLPILQGSNPYHYAGDMMALQCVVAFQPPDIEWGVKTFLLQEYDDRVDWWRNASVLEMPSNVDSIRSGFVIFIGRKPA